MLARAQDASDQGCVLIIPTNNLRIPELREMRPDVNTPMVGNEYRQAGGPMARVYTDNKEERSRRMD